VKYNTCHVYYNADNKRRLQDDIKKNVSHLQSEGTAGKLMYPMCTGHASFRRFCVVNCECGYSRD
jgi:hypothetical protein